MPSGQQKTRTRRSRLAAAGAMVTVGMALAACNSPEPGPAGRPTASSPPSGLLTTSPGPVTPSASPTDERLAVEAAYRAFWPLTSTFDKRYPEAKWREALEPVATEPELSLVIINTRRQRRDGVTPYGETILRPTVPSVGNARKATVTDCQDSSKAGLAETRTGRRKTVGVPRNPVRTILLKGNDSKWRVSQVAYLGGSC